MKNPAVQILRNASVQMLRWCRELGFTPDSRGRIDVNLADDRRSGAERFFSGLE